MNPPVRLQTYNKSMTIHVPFSSQTVNLKGLRNQMITEMQANLYWIGKNKKICKSDNK